MGVDFSGSRVVASRNTLLHDGATNATWSGRFDLGTVPAGRSRVPGAHLGGSLATPNFREFPFFLGTSVNKGDEAGPELLRSGPASCLLLSLGLAARTR